MYSSQISCRSCLNNCVLELGFALKILSILVMLNLIKECHEVRSKNFIYSCDAEFNQRMP